MVTDSGVVVAPIRFQASRRLHQRAERASGLLQERERQQRKQGSVMSESYHGSTQHQEDVKQLHSMGYAQELARRMSGFSNFAISFSIICIIAGGITSFQVGFS